MCPVVICRQSGSRMGIVIRSWRGYAAVPVGGRRRLRVGARLGRELRPRWALQAGLGGPPRAHAVDPISGRGRIILVGEDLAEQQAVRSRRSGRQRGGSRRSLRRQMRHGFRCLLVLGYGRSGLVDAAGEGLRVARELVLGGSLSSLRAAAGRVSGRVGHAFSHAGGAESQVRRLAASVHRGFPVNRGRMGCIERRGSRRRRFSGQFRRVGRGIIEPLLQIFDARLSRARIPIAQGGVLFPRGAAGRAIVDGVRGRPVGGTQAVAASRDGRVLRGRPIAVGPQGGWLPVTREGRGHQVLGGRDEDGRVRERRRRVIAAIEIGGMQRAGEVVGRGSSICGYCAGVAGSIGRGGQVVGEGIEGGGREVVVLVLVVVRRVVRSIGGGRRRLVGEGQRRMAWAQPVLLFSITSVHGGQDISGSLLAG